MHECVRAGHECEARDNHGCGMGGARIHGEPCAEPLEPAGRNEAQRALVRNAATLVLLGVQHTHFNMEMSQLSVLYLSCLLSH